MKCPYCGYALSEGGWSRTDYHTFEQVADFGPVARGSAPPRPAQQTPAIAAIPAGVKMKRQRPARAATVPSDVFVPCAQSIISGLLAMLAVGTIAALAKVEKAGLVGIGAGTGLMLVAWVILLWQHRSLLWERETITGPDLNGDGEIGRPSTTNLEITIPATKEKGQQIMILRDLEATPQQLRIWAAGMLAGRMSENDWCVGKAKMFQRPQFKKLRQQFIDRGLMIWKDEDAHWQGTELTAMGRRVCRLLKRQGVEDEEE
jgi:hypothetical protein